jgi:hypothetical protein
MGVGGYWADILSLNLPSGSVMTLSSSIITGGKKTERFIDFVCNNLKHFSWCRVQKKSA